MELCFLGRGNSTNYQEGNNSAFFIEENDLFLIDCGETVFSKILEKNILKNIKRIHVMITHTHADHIGSLASLIMYCYFNVNIDVNIILGDDFNYNRSIYTLLECMGCSGEMYNIINQDSYSNCFNSFNSIQYLETKHVDYLTCYSIIFYTDDGIIFYSGDSRNIDNIRKIMNSCERIDKLYVDVSSNNSKNSIHLYIGDLFNEVKDIKEKVYCMHFNNQECISKANEYGLGIAKVI